MKDLHEPAGPVLFGYDGSPVGDHALAWAVEEAVLRGVPLVVCHAWHWPYPFQQHDHQALELVRGMGDRAVDDGVRRARRLAVGLELRRLVTRGTPAVALLTAARSASLVVLGSRGSGGFEALRMGSTAMQVPAHTDRPVIVVPPVVQVARHDGVRIVAGVDGSPASDAALDFALSEAELRDLPVTAVCSWWDPGALPGPDHSAFADAELVKRAAKARFEAAVARARSAHPKVYVESRFVVQRPQVALVDIARGATLLVVGDRGFGSAPQTLLGDVTRTVLHEAPCPVAIVHAEDRRQNRCS
ncbi:universal stress protein [Spirillospora sp. NPDC048911]|uniref:universal stress protein n=1 Tax=Spirillospora sp. NPDC048911 TaxID=3364527 RepID=UPI00371FA31B